MMVRPIGAQKARFLAPRLVRQHDPPAMEKKYGLIIVAAGQAGVALAVPFRKGNYILHLTNRPE